MALSINLTGVAFPVTLRPADVMTDEQLMQFSEANKPCKIERNRHGEIIVMTPVGGIGSIHEALVASAFFQWNETVQMGVAFGPNAGFNLLDGACLSPDAAWVSLARWNALSLRQQEGYPPLCPEFLIEIRSRSDSRRLLEAKMQLWLENGAQLAWLIDPIDGDVVIYKPDQAPAVLVKPELVEGTGPVAGFVLRASRLWVTRR